MLKSELIKRLQEIPEDLPVKYYTEWGEYEVTDTGAVDSVEWMCATNSKTGKLDGRLKREKVVRRIIELI